MRTPTLIASMVALSLVSSAWAQPAATQPVPVWAGEAVRTVLPELTLENVPLAAALARIAGGSGGQIKVDWKSLEAVGVTPSSPVRVQAAKVSVAKALDLVLAAAKDAKAPLGWTIYANAVAISTQERILRLRQFGTAMRTAGRPATSGADSASAGAASRPAGAATAPAVAAPPRKRLDFQFDKTPLADAIEFVRSGTGMNVVVNWRALELAGVDQDSPVSLAVTNVPVTQGLDLLLQPFNAGKSPLDRVYWDLQDGILVITTGAALDQQMEVRVYEVGDLLAVVPDFQAGNTSLYTSSSGSTGGNTRGGSSAGLGMSNTAGDSSGRSSATAAPAGGNAADRQQLQDALIAIVQGMIGPEWWQPAGKGSITILRGRMIINQSRLGFILLDRGF